MATACEQVIAPCLYVAALYYMAAFLGLQFAIPPGHATFFWPSAGIALGFVYAYGARALPGVWLGSFMANLMIPLDSDPVRAAIPACGALVQTSVGVWLMRKHLAPGWLKHSRSMLTFFAIAASTACINALWSPCMLDLEPLRGQVWTWWAGDTVGACLFAPAFLAYLGEREERG